MAAVVVAPWRRAMEGARAPRTIVCSTLKLVLPSCAHSLTVLSRELVSRPRSHTATPRTWGCGQGAGAVACRVLHGAARIRGTANARLSGVHGWSTRFSPRTHIFLVPQQLAAQLVLLRGRGHGDPAARSCDGALYGPVVQ